MLGNGEEEQEIVDNSMRENSANLRLGIGMDG